MQEILAIIFIYAMYIQILEIIFIYTINYLILYIDIDNNSYLL